MIVNWSSSALGQEEFSAAYNSMYQHVGAGGPQVEQLEIEFAKEVEATHAIATCNGTAALTVMLMCMREQIGDDITVGVPTFTFAATANAAANVFDQENIKLLDCNRDTWNLDDYYDADIDLLVSVDVGGLSCDYNMLKKLYTHIIADSAESLGSTHNGDPVGTQVLMHCFSMHSAKIISCGEGGMITTNDNKLAKMARSFVNHGYAEDKMSYEYKHDKLGLNFRMTDVHASMARIQLGKLEKFIRHRNEIADFYKSEIGHLVKVQEWDRVHERSNYFFYGILCDNRNKVIAHMADRGVRCKTWTAVHQQPAWDWQQTSCPVATKIANSIVLLPIHNMLTEAEMQYVVDMIKQVL